MAKKKVVAVKKDEKEMKKDNYKPKKKKGN